MLDPIPLSVSLAGLDPSAGAWSGGLRRSIAWASTLPARRVTLDAARGARARDLDASARRDLAASLRRAELEFSGLDLWIPPKDFADPENADRATAAVLAAITLCGELATLSSLPGARLVSVSIAEGTDPAVPATISREAERHGVAVANHRHPPAGTLEIGLDPATVLLASDDPAALVPGAAALRLSDADATGRVEAGTGGLDLTAYAASASLKEHLAFVTLDLRGLPDQDRACRRAIERWGSALELPG